MAKIKTLKEYISYMGGYRIGYVDNISPMVSLGDTPPKGQAGKDSRGVGLNANYSSQAPGTMRPFITANTKRVPRKPGQKAGSDKHSDLYTDENPRGTIHGLGFTDAETAKTSVNKIKNSGKTHAHKIQAAIAMSQRAKVASERAKDPKKKKDLAAAHKIYQSFIDTNKKKD